MPPTTGERFERAVAMMARLRAPGGCPWDREQSFDSIKPYTLEETYEVLEAIDNRDWEELPGELGDLLLQVLFYAQMAKEEGTFSIDQVLDRLSDKLGPPASPRVWRGEGGYDQRGLAELGSDQGAGKKANPNRRPERAGARIRARRCLFRSSSSARSRQAQFSGGCCGF